MNRSKLAHANLLIPQISLGAMSLDYKEPQLASSILDRALALGINYIDTADLYDRGENERLIGKLTKSNRKNWLLASKVGNLWRLDGSGWDWVPSKGYIIQAVEQSLTNLQTDYLDLYQLHGGTDEDPMGEIVEAFELLKAQGKIRAYGISSIRPNVFQNYAQVSQISSNLMQYSLLDRRPEEYLDFLEKSQVSVFVRGALAQGLLVDKPAKSYLGFEATAIANLQRALQDLSNVLQVPKLALALKYPLLHRSVKSIVVGIRTTQQMEELALAIQKLSDIQLSDYEDVLNLLPTNRYTDHRQ